MRGISTDGISIERVTLAEAELVQDILEEAAHWLISRGIDQWRPGQFRMESLAEHVQRGEVFVARRGGEAVGTLTLQESDARIWGERPDDALYVHGLAVRRSGAGRGLGGAMLRWAELQAHEAGKTYLRLDCMAENPALRAYYERAGFAHVGDMYGATWSASLYEKRVWQ